MNGLCHCSFPGLVDHTAKIPKHVLTLVLCGSFYPTGMSHQYHPWYKYGAKLQIPSWWAPKAPLAAVAVEWGKSFKAFSIVLAMNWFCPSRWWASVRNERVPECTSFWQIASQTASCNDWSAGNVLLIIQYTAPLYVATALPVVHVVESQLPVSHHLDPKSTGLWAHPAALNHSILEFG